MYKCMRSVWSPFDRLNQWCWKSKFHVYESEYNLKRTFFELCVAKRFKQFTMQKCCSFKSIYVRRTLQHIYKYEYKMEMDSCAWIHTCIMAAGPALMPIRKSSGSLSYGGSSYQWPCGRIDPLAASSYIYVSSTVEWREKNCREIFK